MCKAQHYTQEDYKQKRELMVKDQIEARGIKDKKVIDAVLKVERHRFVPGKYRSQAYNDYPLPIGERQTISQPYIVALMTEVLNLDSSSRVLEIGTGSGYQAAVLAEICDSVFTVEIIDVLAKRAQKLLIDLGYSNIKVKIGDGYKGWKEHSPYDAIIVTCAPSRIPQPLIDQLAEKGKMIIPVGGIFTQKLVLLVKKNGKIKENVVIPVQFVPMIKENGRRY